VPGSFNCSTNVVGSGVDTVVPAGDRCDQSLDVVGCGPEQFFGLGPVVPWVAAELGFAAFRSRTITTSLQSGQSSSTTTDTAAAFGTGLGFDAWVVERFALSGQFSVRDS
jgi:hypothetical protein